MRYRPKSKIVIASPEGLPAGQAGAKHTSDRHREASVAGRGDLGEDAKILPRSTWRIGAKCDLGEDAKILPRSTWRIGAKCDLGFVDCFARLRRTRNDDDLLHRPYPPGLFAVLAMTSALSFFLTASTFLLAYEEPKRDIFKSSIQRPVAGAQQTASWPVTANLQGISIGSKNSFAVVNGLVLHEGEEKSGIKVVKIRRREVDIEINGVPRTLEMVIHDGTAGKGSRPEPKPEEDLGETVEEESTTEGSEAVAGL